MLVPSWLPCSYQFFAATPPLSTCQYACIHHIILFNTHLCVSWESARRKHSAMILAEMKKWKKRFPNATFFVTGDFNSAPGQSAHRTFLEQLPNNNDVSEFNEGHDFAENDPKTMETIFKDASEKSDLSLCDAWETCADVSEKNNCQQNNIAFSFNAFLGATLSDCYLARIIGRSLFTLNGMEFKLPLAPPTSVKELARAVRDLFTRAPEFSLTQSTPSSWTRSHVDWILHERAIIGIDAPLSSLINLAASYPSIIGICKSIKTRS